MGDEPYAALLPWMVFAVVDRARGGGRSGPASARSSPRSHCCVTSSRANRRRNVHGARRRRLVRRPGGRGRAAPSNSGFLAHDGRAISAAGFALIAFGSLGVHPASEYYTRRTYGRASGTTGVPSRQRADHTHLGRDVHRDRPARTSSAPLWTRPRRSPSSTGSSRSRSPRSPRTVRASAGKTSTTTTRSSPTRCVISRSTSVLRRCTRPTTERPLNRGACRAVGGARGRRPYGCARPAPRVARTSTEVKFQRSAVGAVLEIVTRLPDTVVGAVVDCVQVQYVSPVVVSTHWCTID